MFNLYPIGDIHYGSAACDVPAFLSRISDAKNDPNGFVLGMGDYCEHINMGDKRFDIRSVDPKLLKRLDDLPGYCTRFLVESFGPVRCKIIGLLTGNHEDKLRLRDSNDVHGAMCIGLQAKNLGYDSIIRWKFVRKGATKKSRPSSTVIKIMASHSTIASRQDGGKLNRMLGMSTIFNARLLLFGHGHSGLVGHRIMLDVPESGTMRLVERPQTVVMTGSFRRGYTEGTLDYAEKAGYNPSVIGAPMVRIRPWAQPREQIQVL